jgi:hypothetical protein
LTHLILLEDRRAGNDSLMTYASSQSELFISQQATASTVEHWNVGLLYATKLDTKCRQSTQDRADQQYKAQPPWRVQAADQVADTSTQQTASPIAATTAQRHSGARSGARVRPTAMAATCGSG